MSEPGISKPLAAALIGAGVAVAYSAVVLLIAPGETDRFFAWDIQPPATAAFMGSFYTTAIPLLFILGRPGTPWQRVRPVLPTLIVLSTTMSLATLLHTDRFIWSSPVAWVWSGLYLLYPPLTVILYVRHARRAGPPEPVRAPVARALRPAALVAAAPIAALGGALFVAPERTAGLWPWELTPLTARVVGGWLLFLAGALVAMAREREWSAIRLLFPQAALVLVLLLWGAARFSGALDWTRPAARLYVGTIAFSLAVTAWVFVIHERRSRLVPVAGER